jgi:GxxExxY protein
MRLTSSRLRLAPLTLRRIGLRIGGWVSHAEAPGAQSSRAFSAISAPLRETSSKQVSSMDMPLNDSTGAIIETAIEIHRRLGPGLLESVYRKILAYELRKKGFDVLEEWPIPVVWDDIRLDLGFRADMIVNNSVLVELKSIEKVAPVATKILLTYLRLTDFRLGLLINFREELLKNGIIRIANKYVEEVSRRGAE